MALTALQERFIDTYSADPRSAAAAYVRAGGADGPGAKVTACRYLQHPAISEGVRRQQERFRQEQWAMRDELFIELKGIIHSPDSSASEKLRATELLCKLFGLL